MTKVETVWRPRQEIKVKALGLLWRGDELLVAEIYEDNGALKGVRPLGGTVEFGESWQDTVVREFAEELGVGVHVVGTPVVLENLFTHESLQGHEIVFAIDIEVTDDTEGMLLRANEEILFREDAGAMCRARWARVEDLERLGVPLFPEGLAAAL